MITTHYVLFNGAPQTGKTSATRILRQALNKMDGRMAIEQSMVGPIYIGLSQIFGWGGDYEVFKNTHFFGLTGRQWIIQLAEQAFRAHDKEILCKLLVHRVDGFINEFTQRRRTEFDLGGVPLQHFYVILQNMGFKEEYTFFQRLTAVTDESTSLRIISMHREGFEYGAYDDSREDISHLSDFHLDHPSKILDLIPQL